MGIPDKNTIEKWIVPHLSTGRRGFAPKVPLSEIVTAILYRLKTGCQWRELPVKEFFGDETLTWNSVYHHFNKWSKDGCWRKVWINLLNSNREYLDLSSVEFDGSHTPAKNGGAAVGYQGRKACKTTNALFICDNQGIMLGMSTPQEGRHHDLFQIKELFQEISLILKDADINTDGLFLNADSGFDSAGFRQACGEENIIPNVKSNPRNASAKEEEPYESGIHIFDEELYAGRYVIERSNAWLDAFKVLLVRFEVTVRNWMAWHFLAFTVIFTRKINKLMKV